MNIKPTTTIDESKDEFYTLEDKDFLLITAINNLTAELNMARKRNG